jgi:hypothetical protein
MFTRENVFRPGDAPRRSKPPVPLWTPAQGRDGQLVVVCQDYEELIIHWDGKRNILCTSPDCVCGDVKRAIGSRRKGHFGCWDAKTGQYKIGVVTHCAWCDLQPMAVQLRGQLRGKLLVMSRASGSKKNAVTAALQEPLKPIDPLPPSFDLLGEILRVYNAPLRNERGKIGA